MKKNDKILIGVLFVIALAFLLGSMLMKHNTKEPEAVVLIAGKEYGRYPLAQDMVVKIPGKLGENTLTISEGKAYMSDAVCPDKICMKSGKKDKNSDIIVCLPGEIVIKIENGETSGPDVVVQ